MKENEKYQYLKQILIESKTETYNDDIPFYNYNIFKYKLIIFKT